MFYLFLKENTYLDEMKKRDIFSNEITPYNVNLINVLANIKDINNYTVKEEIQVLKNLLDKYLFVLDKNISESQPHTFIEYIKSLFIYFKYYYYDINILEIINMLYNVYNKRKVKFHDEERDLSTFMKIINCFKNNKPEELWNYIINKYDNMKIFSYDVYIEVLNHLIFDLKRKPDNDFLKIIFNYDILRDKFSRPNFYGKYHDMVQSFYERLLLIIFKYLYDNDKSILTMNWFNDNYNRILNTLYEIDKKYDTYIGRNYMKKYIYNQKKLNKYYTSLYYHIWNKITTDPDVEHKKFILDNINKDLLIDVINDRMSFNNKFDEYTINIFKQLDFSKISKSDILIRFYISGLIDDIPKQKLSHGLRESLTCRNNDEIKRVLKIINYFNRKKIYYNITYYYKPFDNMDIKLVLKLMYKLFIYSPNIYDEYIDLLYEYYKINGANKIFMIHVNQIKKVSGAIKLFNRNTVSYGIKIPVDFLNFFVPKFSKKNFANEYIIPAIKNITTIYNKYNNYQRYELIKILFKIIPRKYHYTLIKNLLNEVFDNFNYYRYDLSIISNLVKLHLDGEIDLSVRSNYFYKTLSMAKEKYMFLEIYIDKLLNDKKIKQQIIKSKLNSMRRS